METNESLISPSRIQRIRVHGYCNISDVKISELAFGNRFAYIICCTALIIGVITANIPILATMMGALFLGVVLPYHPFDYIYNYLLSGMLNKPKLPPRSKQLKFACSIATVWIGATIYLFYTELMTAGYIAGGVLYLYAVAFLVSFFDFCIPSVIYNYIFKINVNDMPLEGKQ